MAVIRGEDTVCWSRVEVASLLAALWPAFTTGRAVPMRLLQAGRSAT